MLAYINKRIRRWCLSSYLRHRFCLFLNMLFVIFVVSPIVVIAAFKRYICELITEIKDLWSIDGYRWLRKEEGMDNE